MHVGQTSSGYFKTCLPSGLRVVVEEIPHVRSVALGFWVKSGSGHEADGQAGHSHLIEHMLFKGTATRSARHIAEAVEGRGGQMNAGTGREFTCVYARVLDEHFEAVFEVLADMLLRPRFDGEDLEREKKVVAEEIKMYLDAPDELCHDLLLEALWPAHPLSRSILGAPEAVGKTTRDSITAYYRDHYVPGRTVVAVAGHVSPPAVMEQVERWLGDWNGSGNAGEITPPEPASQTLIREKDIEQVHICLGTHGPALDHAMLYPTMVLNSVIGGGTASRLFQVVREETGLAYSVYSFQTAMRDAGLVGVYAATSPGTARQALDLIRRELGRIRAESISEEELVRTREHLKGNLMLSLEGTGARMNRLGKSELSLGRVVSPDELVRRIDGVTSEEVAQAAASLFERGRTAVSAVGPIPEDIDI